MNRAVIIMITIVGITMLLHASGYARGHGHFSGGVWIGAPVWGPWWGSYPYYYSVPPVVIERPGVDYYILSPPEQREEPAYWYYCRKPEGYYPYVKQCPDGWMKVVPTPPSQNKEK